MPLCLPVGTESPGEGKADMVQSRWQPGTICFLASIINSGFCPVLLVGARWGWSLQHGTWSLLEKVFTSSFKTFTEPSEVLIFHSRAWYFRERPAGCNVMGNIFALSWIQIEMTEGKRNYTQIKFSNQLKKQLYQSHSSAVNRLNIICCCNLTIHLWLHWKSPFIIVAADWCSSGHGGLFFLVCVKSD